MPTPCAMASVERSENGIVSDNAPQRRHGRVHDFHGNTRAAVSLCGNHRTLVQSWKCLASRVVRRSHNMVFTQGPLLLGESFGHERRIASVAFFSDGDGGTPSLFVQAANLWYDIHDTCIVRFVVDGCRKNLPLDDLTNHGFNRISLHVWFRFPEFHRQP